MYLLSTLPPSVRQSGTARLTRGARSAGEEDRRWFYWRLLVKQRIYRKNRDVLMQLERMERVEKVEETVGEQVGDYERLLRRMKEREAEGDRDEVTVGRREPVVGTGGSRRDRGKRKVVDDEESDLEGTPEPKKVKDRAGG